MVIWFADHRRLVGGHSRIWLDARASARLCEFVQRRDRPSPSTLLSDATRAWSHRQREESAGPDRRFGEVRTFHKCIPRRWAPEFNVILVESSGITSLLLATQGVFGSAGYSSAAGAARDWRRLAIGAGSGDLGFYWDGIADIFRGSGDWDAVFAALNDTHGGVAALG